MKLLINNIKFYLTYNNLPLQYYYKTLAREIKKQLMINYFLKYFLRVTTFSRNKRRIILLIIDYIIINITIFISIFFSNEFLFFNSLNQVILFFIFSSIIGLSIFSITGQYKSLMFYFDISSLYAILFRNFIFLLLLNIYQKLISVSVLGYVFNLLFFSILSLLILSSRLILRDLFRFCINDKKNNLKSVVIFGAGSAGAQLEAALRLGGKYKVVAFIDQSTKLWGRYLNGIKIHSPEYLKKAEYIEKILIAVPSLSNSRRKLLLKDIQNRSIPIFQIPSIEDIASGKKTIDTFKQIYIEDLLLRKKVLPKNNLIINSINKNVICITGGAGSIGSELCNQIIAYKPKELIIVDNSEENLYLIRESLIYKKYSFNIKFILGDVADFNFIEKFFAKNKIDIIFHAAAYKHVPLVESNPISGLRNNVFSTKIICEKAVQYGLKQVVLISSDKAVRPTNIMGTTKRLSEMIIQAFAKEVDNNSSTNIVKTKFSMVRFGNVLNSSGSVVPLFKKQIDKGGPVTITHPKITRYFMMIDEAAQLVLQSSAMSQGGEVFLLDMGKPIYINELAKQMIKLSGYTVKNKDCPNGDIEIINIGLRPGEKLYEELLINADAIPTKHPLIFKANESFIPKDDLFNQLDKLYKLIIKNDNNNKINQILKTLVPEWQGEIIIEE